MAAVVSMGNSSSGNRLFETLHANHGGSGFDYVQLGNFLQRAPHGRVGRIVNHQNHRNNFADVTFELNDRRNSNFGRGENSGNSGEHTRSVDYTQTDVISRNDVVHRQDGAPGFGGNKRGDATFAAAFQIEGGIGQIAEHGAGRRILPGTAAIIKCVAHHVAAYEDRIEHVVDAGENMPVRYERRIDRHLDGRATGSRPWPGRAGDGFFYHAEQLDGVAEFGGELNIERRDVANALDINLFWIDPKAMRQRGQNSDFLRGIVPIHVQ